VVAVRLRFEGSIVGIGSEAGTRLILGIWSQSPFGEIVDIMVEYPGGHRMLIAPDVGVAEFIAGTYRFEEVRIEMTSAAIDRDRCTVTSETLRLIAGVGGRTSVGWMLQLVPGAIARSPRWCRAMDPVVRLVRPGVRTAGTAGGGRREFYCATDEHSVTSLQAVLDGNDLGGLRPVRPPVRFGFGSAPTKPSIVQVTTIIDQSHNAGQ
jgi:hypothetical protein